MLTATKTARTFLLSEPECIVVDLDGTLVFTDTFVAALLEAIRKDFRSIVPLIAAWRKGRSQCKSLAATLAPLDATAFPYNEALIEYLQEQKTAGRRLVLATGADASTAEGVANHLGIFSEVIASENGRNVTGDEKVRAIHEKIGEVPFSYAGNARVDLKVWRESQAAILVGAPSRWARQLRAAGITVREIARPRKSVSTVMRCLRWHQWAKNALVFLPIVLSHQLGRLPLLGRGVIAFLALSLCASGLYIVNDLIDLEADRKHPRKRNRPLASGSLSISSGIVIAALAICGAAALSLTLSGYARVLLLGYAATSLLYSLKVKRMLFLDVVTLALLYAFRVLYGGAAMTIHISVWTLAFSLFVFTSLATVKRLTELRKVNPGKAKTEEYRGYREADINQLSSLAASSGYVAVLVFALYINSPEVTLLYRHPNGLWLLCPVLIYWISRLTLIANRGQLDDDPVAFALKDRATWIVALGSGLIILLST